MEILRFYLTIAKLNRFCSLKNGQYNPLLGIPTYAILVHRTGAEEKMLHERFGEQYQRYAEQTGRFLPRFV